MRKWLHVEDHCRTINLIIRKGIDGEVYNICRYNEKINLEVEKTILGSIGKSDDLISFVADRPGHDKRYAIDPKKLKQTIDWYFNNKN